HSAPPSLPQVAPAYVRSPPHRYPLCACGDAASTKAASACYLSAPAERNEGTRVPRVARPIGPPGSKSSLKGARHGITRENTVASEAPFSWLTLGAPPIRSKPPLSAIAGARAQPDYLAGAVLGAPMIEADRRARTELSQIEATRIDSRWRLS